MKVCKRCGKKVKFYQNFCNEKCRKEFEVFGEHTARAKRIKAFKNANIKVK